MAARPAEYIEFSPDPHQLNERDLTLAFKRGEDGAYRSIYFRYEPRVESVCRRMLGNPEDAKEAAQETFLRVYQGLPSFNGRYQLGAWITRIATNVCLDHLRARSRKPSDPAPNELIDATCDGSEDLDPEVVHIRNMESKRVRRILDSLPPLHRASIVLRDFEGLSYEEIAIALGLTVPQVKALLHRARKGFRRSWTSVGMIVMLPAKLLQRIRRSGEWARDQAGAASGSPFHPGDAVASTQQVASSCSTVFQQCGQYLTERAAGVMAAAVVSTAAVAGGVPAHLTQEPRVAPPVQQQAETTQVVDAASLVAHDEQEARHDPRPADIEPVPEPEPEPVVIPTTVPTPIPEPSPEPSPSVLPEDPPGGVPGTPGGGGGEQPPAGPVEPENFEFSFTVDMAASSAPCDCMQETRSVHESVGVNDEGVGSFDTIVEGRAAAAGTPSYGLWLRQRSGQGTDHNADFALNTSQGSYRYAATGWIVERTRTDWGGWVYRFEGAYKRYSQPGGTTESMPYEGTYSATIVVSWRQARALSVGFVLTEAQ